MPLPTEIIQHIDAYSKVHIGQLDWHKKEFSFVQDHDLREMLGVEFYSTRRLYKIFEGLEVSDELARVQSRYQILSYASIYEAVIHYLLFEHFKDEDKVKNLIFSSILKKISIPTEKQSELKKILNHDGKDIIPCYLGEMKRDENKIHFEEKANCAFELGLIDESLKEDIVEIYKARNMIHIMAEKRKNIPYDIELAKKAYRRMRPFVDQVKERLGIAP